jgi:hypothetical protein
MKQVIIVNSDKLAAGELAIITQVAHRCGVGLQTDLDAVMNYRVVTPETAFPCVRKYRIAAEECITAEIKTAIEHAQTAIKTLRIRP